MTAPTRQPRASRAALFDKRDLARALDVALGKGLKVAAFEVAPDGTIRVMCTEGGVVAASPERNDWD